MAMELVIYGARQFGIKRVPISGFMGIFATEDRDEELKTIWESMVPREYRMGDCHEEVVRPT